MITNLKQPDLIIKDISNNPDTFTEQLNKLQGFCMCQASIIHLRSGSFPASFVESLLAAKAVRFATNYAYHNW